MLIPTDTDQNDKFSALLCSEIGKDVAILMMEHQTILDSKKAGGILIYVSESGEYGLVLRLSSASEPGPGPDLLDGDDC